MSLVKEIIKDLLPEKEKRTIAVYGGGFKPPTSGHFEVVKTAIEKNPNIDKFIILIGGKERDGVTPEESILIWDIYKQYLPINIEIKLSSKPPIQAVYNYAKEHPDEDVIFVIGAREGNEDDFKDIALRTKSVVNYPNLRVETVVTKGGASGTAARNASKISIDKLKPLLPKELKDEEVDQIYNFLTEGRKPKKDPKKGTGKKPKGSKRRLYTDEDPKDTVGIKFSTRQDIVDTLNKKSFKAKSHARQSQIINLIHQRVRAALGRTKDPAKKKKLKSGFEYIKKRKEASKKKTQRLKKQKLNERINSGEYDFKPFISSLTKYMIDNGLKLDPYPQIQMVHDDIDNGMDLFGKTAYYLPSENIIVLFTYGRHPKDILRSYAHELIHVHQNNEGRLENYGTTNVNQDDHLEQIEREAYETGNIMFRSWTDSLNKNELKELLTEGKYDSLVTKLAGYTLNAWKGDFEDKQRKGYFEVEVGPGKDFDYPYLDFTYKAQAIFDNNAKYRESGTAKPFVPEVEIKFVINSNKLPEMWEEISMDLRNIIRHEISHLMQAGPNVKKGKEMDDDSDSRRELKSGKKPWWKIWRRKLGTPDYYKLEKEIDANLEGLYLKAKKSRQPLGKVIDDYLEFKLKLSPKDREDIKNLWRERAPKINVPLFEGKNKDPFGLNAYAMELARGLEEQESDYKVYLDMDGVVANFDKRFEDLSGMAPNEFESKYGKNKFWDFIDEDHKVSFWVGIEVMPGADKLINAVKDYNYELLTAPSVKKQSYLGKILWVRNHSDLLGGKPKINFKKAKSKHKVKPELSKTDILVDDRADTIDRWNSAGGTGIVYRSADQVVNDLKKLGL